MAKYSPEGERIWAESYDAGGIGLATGNGIALGANGQVIAAGIAAIEPYWTEAVIVTRDRDGVLLDHDRLWNEGLSKGHDVAAEGDRVVIIGAADPDTDHIGSEDLAAWAGKLRSTSGGTHQWTKTIHHDESSADIGWGVAMHQGSTIAVGLSKDQSEGVWLHKYDESGNKVWERSFAGWAVYERDLSTRVVVDGAGNSYIVSTVHDDDGSGANMQVHKVAP